MAKKTKLTDMAVLLPGITGSVLQKDGKDVWAILSQAISKAVLSLGDSLDHLLLKDDDPQVDDLGDGIQATRPTFLQKVGPGHFRLQRSLACSLTDPRSKGRPVSLVPTLPDSATSYLPPAMLDLPVPPDAFTRHFLDPADRSASEKSGKHNM